MPRNITVTFDDGTTHVYRNAPDNLTPDQVSARAQSEFGKSVTGLDGGKKASESGMFDGVIDTVKNIGTGLAKGFGGLATMAGDAFADDPQTRMAVAAAGGKQPKVGDVSRMVSGMGYQPKTAPERYQQSIAAGVGGAMFPGPGVVSAPIKQMAIGGSAGLGAEVGSQLSGGNPIAGLAGGLIGGGVAGVAANLKGNSPALAREALQGVDPRDLERAKINQFRAQKAGVPINLSQAMEKPSNIDAIVEALANSRNGKKVTQQLRDQPKQVGVEIENQMLKLPGAVRAPQTVANNAQEVATKVVEGAKKSRTEAWSSTFTKVREGMENSANAATQMAEARLGKMKGRLTQAQQLEASKIPKPPTVAIPTGVGATRSGILLDDAGRGQAAMNVIDSNAGRNSLEANASGILGSDGRPLVTPPKAGMLEGFEADVQQAQAGLKAAQTAEANVGQVPQEAVSKAFQRLTQEAEKNVNTGVGNAILDLRNKLINGEQGYITDGAQLNNILKDVTTKLKTPTLNTPGVDAGGAKYIGGLVNELREGWGQAFAPIREANAVFKQQTDDVVNPLKKSVVGDIAGRRGAVPDAQAVKTKLTTLFDAGTVPGAKSSDILKMEKAFRTVPEGPEGLSGSAAYQDAVKSWMAGKVSSASQMEGGRIDPNVAANLEKIFRGDDTKAQGFRDMLVGLARSEGKPDASYVKGMENFLKVTSMAARRPARVQGLSTGGAAEIAGQTLATQNGQTSWSPMRNLLIRWSERVNADAYKEMDRLLTSPEGVDMLQKLAKTPPTSPAAQTAVATFLGTNASMLDEQGQQPPEQ